MSGKVVVVAGSSLETSGGQTNGMARQNAIQGLSDQLCGSGESAGSCILITSEVSGALKAYNALHLSLPYPDASALSLNTARVTRHLSTVAAEEADFQS